MPQSDLIKEAEGKQKKKNHVSSTLNRYLNAIEPHGIFKVDWRYPLPPPGVTADHPFLQGHQPGYGGQQWEFHTPFQTSLPTALCLIRFLGAFHLNYIRPKAGRWEDAS